MTDSKLSSSNRGTAKRLLRILVGGAILATAWVAIDLITHSESASASEISDGPSSGSRPVSDIVAPLIERVTSIAAQVSTGPAASIEQAEAVVEHTVSAIISNSLVAIAPVVETLAAPILPVVADMVCALPPLPHVAIIPTAGVLLPGDGLDVALASSNTPLVPTPVGGVPRELPAVPPPSADHAGGAVAVLNSALVSPPGSALTTRATTAGIPPSPTYGFDTTPD